MEKSVKQMALKSMQLDYIVVEYRHTFLQYSNGVQTIT